MRHSPCHYRGAATSTVLVCGSGSLAPPLASAAQGGERGIAPATTGVLPHPPASPGTRVSICETNFTAARTGSGSRPPGPASYRSGALVATEPPSGGRALVAPATRVLPRQGSGARRPVITYQREGSWTS